MTSRDAWLIAGSAAAAVLVLAGVLFLAVINQALIS